MPTKIQGLSVAIAGIKSELLISITKMLQDAKFRKQVGEIIVRGIKERKNFGAPADSTSKWRQRYDRLNATDKNYSRGKLNATFTGELLDDLGKNIKTDPTKRQIIVENSEKKHKKYQGVTKKIGSMSSYKKISEGLIESLGYDYLELDDEALDEIDDLINKRVKSLMRGKEF